MTRQQENVYTQGTELCMIHLRNLGQHSVAVSVSGRYSDVMVPLYRAIGIMKNDRVSNTGVSTALV